ncbi:MAG TPA: GGDEF domain-containing protein [Candidatus Limnocylindrales bacterium]|nr:GGDEF domain-containing protein [Candidatus Limnocylindrales bacterium]
MILAIGVAVLDCIWLVAFHLDAAALILALNVTIALVAAAGFLMLGSVARRRPEGVVFATLVAVDAVTITLGLGYSPLGFVAVGYLLLLPVVVSLVIPWATRIHVTWLGLHAALALGYTLLAPAASIPEGARDQLLGLFIVAIAVSQSGHVTGVRGRVSNFTQIQQIKALNRQARRDQVRVDSLNAALETTAATDMLTGLGNRLALDAGLRLARSRIERQRESYGLLILDLDRFKAINDEHGHLAGDEVLRAASEALRGVLRAGDSAYRYGGEEFVALISLTRAPEALAAAERFRTAIESLQIPNARNAPYGHLTTSVGVTTIGPLDLSADDASWLERADAALYRAKANGRNRVEVDPCDANADGADRWSSPADRERRSAMPFTPWSKVSPVPALPSRDRRPVRRG